MLEETVKKVLSDSILPVDKVPKIIDRWRASDVLTGVDSSDWNHDCTDLIRKHLAKINDSDVSRFYSEGNEANLERARKLVDGGNVLARETLTCRFCRDNVDDSPRVMIQCDVVPHMKGGPNSKVKAKNIDGREKEYYTVFLCFTYGKESIESRRVCKYPIPAAAATMADTFAPTC